MRYLRIIIVKNPIIIFFTIRRRFFGAVEKNMLSVFFFCFILSVRGAGKLSLTLFAVLPMSFLVIISKTFSHKS